MDRYEPEQIEVHEHGAWEAAAPIYVDYIANLTANSGQLELVQDLVEISETDRVLDVGCGPGVLTAHLRLHSSDVTGVDFSAQMIAEAQRLHPEIEFRVANAEELPFPDDAFNVAVVNYCAHHLARPQRAFSEIRRVLAPGGILVVIHPIQSRQPSWGSFADAVSAVLPPETVPGGVLLDASEPRVYVELLQACGYVNVTCEAKQKPVLLPNLDVLLEGGWIITGLHGQPQAIQDRIALGVRERADAYRNDDDSYTFPDYVLAPRAIA